ncbi:hypothetical protein GOP47_0010286 [Adiantum capillus-veneris]|uniref:MBD domain-containing protein n=1 Tax=Adiantum capillus-veneris TaxID=13818 RepID=A0A9D4UUE8_ADICA|nr:hypothetical protein GOP47_0010286 [Adiantum capillus-veneris]
MSPYRECGKLRGWREEEDLAFSAAYEDDTPAPSGWRRKLVRCIGKGMIPIRTDVIFITPSGEEFKSRVQLQRYLKANKGGPNLSEFIWIVDGMQQRSTRSKSAPMVQLLGVLRATGKRKLDTSDEGVGKRRRMVKTHKCDEEPKVAKGNHVKHVDTATTTKGINEDSAVAGVIPASTRKKRSVKVMKRKIWGPPTTATTQSANANGVPEISSMNDEKANDTGKKVSTEASKTKWTKGRLRGKKGGVLQDDPLDFPEQEVDVDVNDDKGILGGDTMNADSGVNVRGEGKHTEESFSHEEAMAATDEGSHLIECVLL